MPASTFSERQHRVIRAVMFAIAFGSIEHTVAVNRVFRSDLSQVWFAAGAWLRGVNPYSVVGPGREFVWDYPLLYPMPAVMLAVPLAPLSRVWADTIFVGLGCGALAFALLRRLNNPQLLVFTSCAMLSAVLTAQWSPLLSATAALPVLGFLWACKPTLGLAMLAGWPSRPAVVGAALFGVASLVLAPWWVREWLAALPAGTHLSAPITRPGGFLVLLTLLRWRQPEARFLLAFACVPQTAVLYEAVPLFLVTRGWLQSAALVMLTYAVMAAHLTVAAPRPGFDAFTQLEGRLMLWLLYLPCVAFVLARRPEPASSPGDASIVQREA